MNRDCISTEDFTSKAFGWTSDEVSRQQDVHELNRYLLEWLESQLRSTSARYMIRNLFKGEEETMMEVNGKIVSKRSQNFLDIALPVEGQRDLVQGLFKVFRAQSSGWFESISIRRQVGRCCETHSDLQVTSCHDIFSVKIQVRPENVRSYSYKRQISVSAGSGYAL